MSTPSASGAPQNALTAEMPAALRAATEHVAEGRLGKAEGLLRRYVHDNPGDVNGIRLLGEVGLALGALADAESLLRRCVDLAPDYQAARYAYANALYKRHRYIESIGELDILLAGDPTHAGWLVLKAANLVELNEHDRALPLFESVLTIDADHAQALLSYGHALRALGRADQAVAAYLRAARLGVGEAYWSLANLKTFRFDTELIAAMQSLLADENCKHRDYYHLLFALGKAREDQGNYQGAMAAYVKGNQVRSRSVPWDAARFRTDVQELKAFFTAEFFAEHDGQGNDARDPIFVVGLPRAGSTLIEQILASHSQVEGTAELADVIAMARRIAGKKRRDDVSRYPAALADFSASQWSALGAEYLERTAGQRRSQRPFFIDKMPNNFTHVGLIHLMLPNATIIDARRHPMDCCFSGFKQLFAAGQGFSYGMQRIGNYYRDYLDLMDHWDEVLPGRVLRVQYEDVIRDAETQIRRLLTHCGLDFEPACLAFHDTERTVRTASSEQVRQPLNDGGLGQWRPFSQWLDPLREALGPALDRYPEASSPVGRRRS